MGRHLASCGHSISKKWYESDKSFIAIKDKNGSRFHTVTRLVVCKQCLAAFRKQDLILETIEEEELWMKG